MAAELLFYLGRERRRRPRGDKDDGRIAAPFVRGAEENTENGPICKKRRLRFTPLHFDYITLDISKQRSECL